MKYILIVGGIVLSFLSDVFEKEKKEGEAKKIKVKRFTIIGMIILLMGLCLSIIGVWQAINDESEAKNEKTNIKEKAKRDSINFANKNFSDSVRFMLIINQLNNTQKEVVKNAHDIVSTTLKESGKNLDASKRNQFLLPDKLEVSFVMEFIIKNKDIEACDKLMKTLYAKQNNRISTLIDLNPDFVNNINRDDSVLLFLHKLGNGGIFYGISFIDIKNQPLFYVNYKSGSFLSSWNRSGYNKTKNNMTDFMISYEPSRKRFILYGNYLSTDIKRTSNSGSLLDVLNSKMVFELTLWPYDDMRDINKLNTKLLSLQIKTSTELELDIHNFKTIGVNLFEKKLERNDIWK